jgi:Tfp pilus assembly protein PilO
MPSSNIRMDYQKKIYLHLAITASLFVAVFYFGIAQPAEKMEEMKTTMQTEKGNLEKSYITGNSLRQLAESLKVVEPQLSKLDDVFIKKEFALDFITSMEKVAEKVGIQQRINLATANKSGSKSKDKNETIPIQLSSSGSFNQEMRYLASLEALNYYINIKSLEISNSTFRAASWTVDDGVAGGDSQSQVGLQILADTYWQNQ